jgi:hypothetical protein
VPGLTIPQAQPIQIPSATAPPPLPAPATPRNPRSAVPSYITAPTPGQMAGNVLKVKAPTLPEQPAAPITAAPPPPVAGVASASPLPVLTAPVLFTAPLADRILSGLQVFPPDNPWHQDISQWPLHPNSKNIVAAVGANMGLRYNLDMGFILVPPYQPRVAVRIIDYPAESDPGPYPVPDEIPIEGWPVFYKRVAEFKNLTLDDVQRDKLNRGGDRHAIVIDPANRMLYEFFGMRKTDAGWQASQASIFDLKTNKLRPAGWTSADAAGLPIFPAVVRYDELVHGHIDHALRVTVPRTRKAYVAPATHFASALTDENLPRMGERFRLKQDFDSSQFAPEVRTILTALKQHGMFVADNGNLFAISVAPDERMPPSLGELGRLTCADFEIVVAPQ